MIDLLERAEAHLASGDLDSAANIANVYINEIEPHTPRAFLLLAEIAQQRRRFAQAAGHAWKALLRDPGDRQLRERHEGALAQLAAHNASQPQLVKGASHLLDRLDQERHGEIRAAGLDPAKCIDFVLPMAQLSGAALHVIEVVRLLQKHVETRLWSDLPVNPELLAMFSGIRRITGEDYPRGDTLVVSSFAPVRDWAATVRPRRLVLNFSGADVLHLLPWLAAATGMNDCRVDLLFASPWMQHALGLSGAWFPSPIDVQRFKPGGEGRPLARLGRLSRDEAHKHHPGDAALYQACLDRGLSVDLLGATQVEGWMPRHPRFRSRPAFSIEAEKFLGGLDLFVYRTGSRFEHWGRVVFEAMASGVPVLCHRIGGYADFVRDGENGYLFGSNEEALARIEALLGDAARLRDLGAGARATAESLVSPAILDGIVAYFISGSDPFVP